MDREVRWFGYSAEEARHRDPERHARKRATPANGGPGLVMPKAICLIREGPHYRREAFETGLRACGYDVTRNVGHPKRSDLLILWNRYDWWAHQANEYEAAGAAVIIAENGLIGASHDDHGKPRDTHGDRLYQMALRLHNGAGAWHIGARDRWRAQGVELKPWRENGEHVLLLVQRGFGHPAVVPPREWLQSTVKRLRTLTHRPLQTRAHPGNERAVRPLEADLEGCWCAVTWGSGAGIKALCAGVPVYSDWPAWVGFPSALPLTKIGLDIAPSNSDRETMLNRLAWLQWTTPEIASGEPFEKLLALHQKRQHAA